MGGRKMSIPFFTVHCPHSVFLPGKRIIIFLLTSLGLVACGGGSNGGVDFRLQPTSKAPPLTVQFKKGLLPHTRSQLQVAEVQL